MTQWKRRSAMRPGEMFGLAWDRQEVLVVLDAKTEVGLWRGGSYRVGDVAPGVEFEVLS